MKRHAFTVLLAAAGLFAVTASANAQPGIGPGFSNNPYSVLPPGFYNGFYYNVPGTPYVLFRGNYTGPGNPFIPGGTNVPVNKMFQDTPGTASRAAASGYGGLDSRQYPGLLNPATRSFGARVGAGAASRPGANVRREIRDIRADDDDQIQIRVVLPTEDAKVWFDDAPTRQQGVERIFVTPSLERGNTYTAKVTAAWKENGKEVKKEKKVEVRAGRDAVVDFTEPEPADAPRPQEKPDKELPPQ
jgi:uncharacterized protein (TIGR03000 family)